MSTRQHIPLKSAVTFPSFTPARGALLQRKCACGGTPGPSGECEACRKKRLQRKSNDAGAETQNASAVPPIVDEVLRAPGQPLDASTRAFMEPRFGHDFSQVRVHTGASAEKSARDVNASAYTIGDHIVFGTRQYAPETSPGTKLLAHELTHTIQQPGGLPRNFADLQMTAPESAVEGAADRAADSVVAGGDAAIRINHPVSLARQHVGRLEPVPTYATATPRQAKPSPCPGKKGGCVGGKWVMEYDGCSLPALLASLFNIDKDNPGGGENTQFALCGSSTVTDRACDRHDECYQTCNFALEAKAACDRRMYNDMLKTCLANSEYDSIKERCLRYAGAYYAGLQTFPARMAFDERQSQVCACGGTPGPAPVATYGVTPTPKKMTEDFESQRKLPNLTPVPTYGVTPTQPTTFPQKINFWFHAFIPNTVSGAKKAPGGPFAGRTVFPSPPFPFHRNSCFETDERGFDSTVAASSRVRVVGILDTVTRTLGSAAVSDLTFEIDCTSGSLKCQKTPSPSVSVSLMPALLTPAGQLLITFLVTANDPCVTGSPDLAARGIITIDRANRTFSFTGATSFYPAFEMYASFGGGPTTVFKQVPIIDSPLALLSPGVNPRDDKITF